jgi:D-alanyl-D-alanine carboxypeptidase
MVQLNVILIGLVCIAVACSPAADGSGTSDSLLELPDSTIVDRSAARPDRAPAAVTQPLPDPRVLAFAAAVAVLPPERALAVTAAFAVDPDRFFDILSMAETESAAAGGMLQLVDKRNGLDPAYEPPDLVPLSDYQLTVSRNDLRLRLAIMDAVMAMDAAARADGITLVYSSAYRSYSYQDGLFERYSRQHGVENANRFSARPGDSQHQLGTAIDFGSIDDSFATTSAGQWLAANAWRFGFSLSYPMDMEHVTGYVWESWHYRYITKAGAILEREYFGGIQQYLLEFLEAYRQAINQDAVAAGN